MYDIIKEMWKNPGAQFSLFPIWLWNGRLDAKELDGQLSEFHRKGIDGVVICPSCGMTGAEYLSDEYFAVLREVLEGAKKRHMLVVIADDAASPSGTCGGGVLEEDERLSSRMLYRRPVCEDIPTGEELLFRIYVKLDADGYLEDVRLEKNEGYDGYNLILGYTGGEARGLCGSVRSADVLNSYAAEIFINLTHEKYYEKLSEYFGSVITGFYTVAPTVTGKNPNMNGGIPWSYNLIEEWLDEGGDFAHLAKLLFDTKNKKDRREAEYILDSVTRKRMCEAYYAPLSKWCRDHGVLLMGYPSSVNDTYAEKFFGIPGQKLTRGMITVENALTSRDSVLVKCAADKARHMGLSHSSLEVFEPSEDTENPWDFSPDEMMRTLNFVFARGCSMVIPHAFCSEIDPRVADVGLASAFWADYKKLAMYAKRMSWLNSSGTNNPVCAVLCTPEYMPYTPVRELYEEGYTFNYLTTDDLMEKVHIHGGKLLIDRYEYDMLLIDSRLRLNSEIVKKIGKFMTEGGLMFRGSDFIDFVKKHVRRKSYFKAEEKFEKAAKNLRFGMFKKSGCPFFSLINEGEDIIVGSLITDNSGRAEMFDPFTGKTERISAKMVDEGFSYRVKLAANSALVIGIDPSSLISLDEEEAELHLSETAAISNPDRLKFEVRENTARVILSAEEVRDMAEIKVNGVAVGKFLFRPYEAEITEYCIAGENEVEFKLIPSSANRYGSSVPEKITGVRVRLYNE